MPPAAKQQTLDDDDDDDDHLPPLVDYNSDSSDDDAEGATKGFVSAQSSRTGVGLVTTNINFNKQQALNDDEPPPLADHQSDSRDQDAEDEQLGSGHTIGLVKVILPM